MICKDCATGADLGPEIRALTRSPQRTGLIRRRNNLHGQCKGCDCQHAGTPHYRKPDQTPTLFTNGEATATGGVTRTTSKPRPRDLRRNGGRRG